MSNSNTGSIAITMHKTAFHFKSYTADKDGYKKLEALLNDGKITAEDIGVVHAKDEAGNDLPDVFKRASVELELAVPIINIPELTANQNAHVQALVNKAITEAQRDTVNVGDIDAKFLIGWDAVLESSYRQKNGAAKVTTELLEAVVERMRIGLEETGSNEQVVLLSTSLGGKKFSLSACQPVPRNVLEKLQGIIVDWMLYLEETDAPAYSQAEPVFNLWATNIEKVLKPAQEINMDMFG